MTTDTTTDRVQLPFAFDANAMAQDVANLQLGDFIYYDVMPLRAPAHEVDPSLPQPPPADDYADGSWTDWLDTKALQECPKVLEVVNFFRQHCTVNLVRLLRLQAGALVREHTDPTLGLQIERSMVRLTIPIVSSPEVEFYLNNELVPMRPGECWYMRLTDPHRIEHKGTETRVNLTIDVVPNDWVQEVILTADQQLA